MRETKGAYPSELSSPRMRKRVRVIKTPAPGAISNLEEKPSLLGRGTTRYGPVGATTKPRQSVPPKKEKREKKKKKKVSPPSTHRKRRCISVSSGSGILPPRITAILAITVVQATYSQSRLSNANVHVSPLIQVTKRAPSPNSECLAEARRWGEGAAQRRQ